LKKDVQILAMVSIVLLQACRASSTRGNYNFCVQKQCVADCRVVEKSIESKDDFRTPLTSTSKFPGGDYFSLSRRTEANRALPMTSQNWPRLPISPTTPAAAAISSSNSSRGSWSITGSVRQFMSGVQDTLKDGLSTPSSDHMTHGAPIPVPGGKPIHPTATSPRHGRDSSIHSTGSIPRSWGDNPASNSAKGTIVFSSVGHVRRSTFSQITNSRITIPEKKILIFDELTEERYVFCAVSSYLSMIID
jgi:WD repeat-containing protein 59